MPKGPFKPFKGFPHKKCIVKVHPLHSIDGCFCTNSSVQTPYHYKTTTITHTHTHTHHHPHPPRSGVSLSSSLPSPPLTLSPFPSLGSVLGRLPEVSGVRESAVELGEFLQHLGQLGEGGPLSLVVRPARRQDLLGGEDRTRPGQNHTVEPKPGLVQCAMKLTPWFINAGRYVMLRLKVPPGDSGVVD